MQYTINQLKQELFGRVYEVYDIFKNFFGERFVDLQGLPSDEGLYLQLDIQPPADGEEMMLETSSSTIDYLKSHLATPFILVHWPSVTVTNENDRSVQIQDLYAQINITFEGTIPYENAGFQLNRTTFSELQFSAGYLHSHIPCMYGEVPQFHNPCLGTGPIKGTIMDLKNNYEETLWMLFCQELSLYVTVESLAGGPYFRLESIGNKRLLVGYEDYHYDIRNSKNGLGWLRASIPEARRLFTQFIPYYLQHGHLSFNYKDNMFIPGMPFFDFMIDISNAFIDYYNDNHTNPEKMPFNKESLYLHSILRYVFVSDGKFYSNSSINRYDYSEVQGSDMFVFKGEMQHLNIFQDWQSQTVITTLLDSRIAMYILNSVLRIINYRYRNEHNKQLSSNSTGETAPTYQTVVYL